MRSKRGSGAGVSRARGKKMEEEDVEFVRLFDLLMPWGPAMMGQAGQLLRDQEHLGKCPLNLLCHPGLPQG